MAFEPESHVAKDTSPPALTTSALTEAVKSPEPPTSLSEQPSPASPIASGEKTKAHDIVAAIRTVQTIEHEQRPATPEEKQTLARFTQGVLAALGGPAAVPGLGRS